MAALRILAIAALCGLMTWVSTPRAVAEEKPADVSKEKPKTAPPATVVLVDRLDQRLPEINFSGQELGDVIDFLRDVSGTEIFVDWNRLGTIGITQKSPVTLKLKDVKFSAAVEKVLAAVGTDKGKAQATTDDGQLVISVVPDPNHPWAGVIIDDSPIAMKKLDRRLPEVNFNNTGLTDVIDFLRDVSGLKITVDWESLKLSGVDKESPVGIYLKNTPLGGTLKRVLESVSNGKAPIKAIFLDGVLAISAGPAPKEPAGVKK